MRVLVTGASGMLGSRLALTLAERGNEVTVLQRRPSETGLREVLADVADAAAVDRAVRGQDAVVHAAAKVDVLGAWQDFVRTNVDGTRAVVAACRAQEVPRLVYVSSPSVAHLGHALMGVGAGSAEPHRARGAYARSKAIAEQLALAADHAADATDAADAAAPDPMNRPAAPTEGTLSVVAIRPHLVWGPGDTQLVGRLVARARAGRLPIIGSGAALIDTTYITNAVDALIAAVDRCEHAHGQALVVSNGEPRMVGELIGDICTASGAPRPDRHVPKALATAVGALAEVTVNLRSRLGHPAPASPPLTRFLVEQLTTAHWFDQRRTREVLDWTPRVSIDAGLSELTSATSPGKT